MVTLYSPEIPELKLGPGRLPDVPANIIRFRDGFASIPDDDPDLEEKLRWTRAGGTPPIEVLPDEEAAVRASVSDPAAFVCQKCAAKGLDKAFKNNLALMGHMRSHAKDVLG